MCQGAVLAGLLGYGVVWPDVALSGMQTVVIPATVLLPQALCSWLWTFPTYDLRRALISGFPLCVLRHTHTLPLPMLWAYLT